MPRKKTEERTANSGIYVTGGQIEQSDYDDLEFKTLMQDYTSMRNDDSIASTSVDILVNPILNANFKIEPGYQEGEKPSELAMEAAEFVQETYNQLQSGLKYYMRHKLLALYYGFSMFEKVWKRGDVYEGKVVNRLIDLYPIQQDTIWWWKYDEKANFTGIKQEQRIPEGGFRHIDINVEDLHVYTPFEEYKNVQGRSLLRSSRLVWKIKKQIWLASGRASSRGAGIPEFIITPSGNATTDTALKSKLETIAKNVGNSENSYVISQKDLVEFKLHTLQNQEANLQLIQQANTEMFYNTMSEFVTSGIGSNGSRAATGEHKSPYFDTMDSIIKTFEDNEDKLIQEIIENSPYIGQLEKEEIPYCKIERPKNTDIIAVGNLISTLTSSGVLSRGPDIEVYVRNILGLPEKTEEEIEGENDGMQENKDTEETEVETKTEVEKENDKELKDTHDHAHKLNQNYIDNVFELTNAQMIMQTAENAAEVVVNDVYKKIIDDVAMKLAKNPKEPVYLGYKKELIDRLSSIYNRNYKPGQIDVRKEYAKISSTRLAMTPIIVEGTNEKLVAKVDTLYSAIENSIRDELLLINQRNIDNAGGMENYIKDRFGQTQKQIRNDLVSIASSGYLAGRNDQMTEFEIKDPELKRMYITALEGREDVCEVCRPLNFITFNKEEAEQLGLKFDGAPINPTCLGGNKCRCTWGVAYGNL